MTANSLKQRLRDSRILVAPGVADTLSATLAENAGFEAVFLSGSSMAFAHLGRPDIGLLSLTEVASITARVADRVEIPVLVDADSGFGNAYHVYRSVRTLEQAGASCLQIEDQIHDQHPSQVGKRPVVSIADMQTKLRAALDARRSDKTLISARSDAVYSESVAEALERAAAYAETGVDIVFVEGLADAKDRDRLVELIGARVALLFNMALPGGAAAPDIAALHTEGYSIALSPAIVINAAAKAVETALLDLRQQTPGIGQQTRSESSSVAEMIHDADFIEKYLSWSGETDQ